MSDSAMITDHTLTVNIWGVTNRIDFQREITPEGVIVHITAAATYTTAPLDADTALEMSQVKHGRLLASALEQMADALNDAINAGHED